MVENRPLITFLTHLVLVLGVLAIALPVWITFVASTHDQLRMNQAPLPLWPGDYFLANMKQTLFGSGLSGTETAPVWLMLLNSLAMALMISTGKIAISLLSAFAIVYFKFPFRMGFFWMIFITLMLPVEVRILPTFEVVANLGMLNSYWGLSIPLIASATATFMFRQVFLTVPDELLESARIDGAGPLRFFFDILLPLSRTNIAALFVILFIFGWNQYLWPLLITTDTSMTTIVMSIKQMLEAAEQSPQWNIIMTTALLAMIPPVFVVIAMQKLFVQGLTETDK
ncbi:sn-glycerol-3-phosphate ABC transporter permease UgpE [Leisingera aquimarina]|uniref:sn-glycerol-3-phosphate ABC transporter permease UgpE n=1 Tax=Leisingera aquimarina TaxID=476529 RepID=UPI0003F89723|nr:sn-glycerol-3-phosphate ABC transporter permease UgpE [Leisingera aquimarina]